MQKLALALIVASFAAISGATFAQRQPCLHGPSETPDQMARRRAALSYTRQVNTAEAAVFARTGTYLRLPELVGPSDVPDGFVAQLSTDGTTYTFSVKDATDTCQFAFFSDQIGVIFTASPIQ
jgi:hypothetical protein